MLLIILSLAVLLIGYLLWKKQYVAAGVVTLMALAYFLLFGDISSLPQTSSEPDVTDPLTHGLASHYTYAGIDTFSDGTKHHCFQTKENVKWYRRRQCVPV